MKKLPIGIQSFAKLRDDNCVYVDKTELIYGILLEDCERTRRLNYKKDNLKKLRSSFQNYLVLY